MNLNHPVGEVVEIKSSSNRLVMHVLYGMHTVAWPSMGTLTVIALIVNYIARSDETDALYWGHHDYMIRTFWWTLLWCAVTCPLFFLFFVPGVLAWAGIGFWYLYRCIKGWLRFNNNRMPL